MIRNKCWNCGKVWYCRGDNCGGRNCECDDCMGKVSTEKCQEVKGIKREWRIA